MPDYIDREALLEKSWDVPFETEDAHFVRVVDALDILVASAADVEKVRHCRWVLVKNGTKRDIYRCPWCGRLIDTIIEETELARLFPYCHCGTKMDRGDD